MKKINQNGSAIILVVFVFMMVIMAVSVGFAYLSNNESQETLDKTLSYQAQYAAESAINKIAAGYKAPVSISDDSTCGGPDTYEGKLDSTNPIYSDVEVSCATYSRDTPTVIATNITNNPSYFKIQPKGNIPIAQVVFTWKPTSSTCDLNKDTAFFESFNKPSGCPALKIAVSSKDAINKSLTLPGGKAWIGYSTPTPLSSIPLDYHGKFERFALDGYQLQKNRQESGEDDTTYCTLTAEDPPGNWQANSNSVCRVVLPLGSYKWTNLNYGVISLAGIGGNKGNIPEVQVTALDASDTQLQLVGAQAVVDVTAKAGETIKRLRAYVPLSDNPVWQPPASAMANGLCKNYRVDGSQATAGPADPTLCY